MHFPQYWPEVGGLKERSTCFSARAGKETQASHPGLGLTLLTGQQPSLERPADYHCEQGSLWSPEQGERREIITKARQDSTDLSGHFVAILSQSFVLWSGDLVPSAAYRTMSGAPDPGCEGEDSSEQSHAEPPAQQPPSRGPGLGFG